METGDTFFVKGITGDRTRRGAHLQIIICIRGSGGDLALIPVTTNPKGDVTTKILATEHPALGQKLSYLFYAKARKQIGGESSLTKAFAKGLAEPSEPLSVELIARVLRGAVSSDYSPDWLVKVATNEIERLGL